MMNLFTVTSLVATSFCSSYDNSIFNLSVVLKSVNDREFCSPYNLRMVNFAGLSVARRL